MRVWGMPAGPA